mmetsp:Transcript_376/g.876  ORF Transcript_376/g.876 Transcript_376/m.876 type:complete len:268 (-) Transcript_376:431-1234(-)
MLPRMAPTLPVSPPLPREMNYAALTLADGDLYDTAANPEESGGAQARPAGNAAAPPGKRQKKDIDPAKKLSMNRGRVDEDGYHMCKQRDKFSDITYHESNCKLVPDGYKPGDLTCCGLNAVERRPCTTGVYPHMFFVNVERGAADPSDTSGLTFSDHRPPGERGLPMMIDESSPAYDSIAATVADHPSKMVRVADLVGAAAWAHNGFAFTDPPPLATRQDMIDMTRLHPEFAHLFWKRDPLASAPTSVLALSTAMQRLKRKRSTPGE